jgi:hypothetical protein
MTTGAQMLKAALWYQAKKGYCVIPVGHDKKPKIKWAPYQAKKADADQVREWWTRWPDAMIGIVTGKISGVMVVDVDSQAGYAALNEFLPEDMTTPAARTPGGGWHFYFKHQVGLVNRARVITDCDVRTDGGYIVIPPSQNEKGGYTWLPDLKISDVQPAPMPEMLFNILQGAGDPQARSSAQSFNKENSFSITRGAQHPEAQHGVTNRNNRNITFEVGRRDEDFFHVATCLSRGGMDSDNALICLQYLNAGIANPFPEDELHVKIDSAFKRLENKKRNLTADIQEWVSVTWGNISVTDAIQNVTSVTNADRPKIRVIMSRLVDKGILERVPSKDGVFRKVDSQVEEEDWQNATTETVDIRLPFELNRISKIQPGNIITIMGDQNAGKTGVMMNIARDNMDNFKIHYFSSEMGPEEFKSRTVLFPNIVTSQWKVKLYQRATNFSDVIRPGKGNINIIDYLEIHDNFYLVAKYLSDIHAKLDGAIAVIGLQKSPGQDIGRGGSFALEKPRLSLALSHGEVKIVKCKAWQGSENPNGKIFNFKLVGGCQIKKTVGWHVPLPKD